MSQRQTVQKSAIMDSLRRLGHPSAEEIWHDVRQSCPDINRTTVYRNLRRYVDEGLATLVLAAGSPERYELRHGKHDHLRCSRCGQICNLNLEPARLDSDELKKLSTESGWLIQEQELILSGLCTKCRSIQEKENEHGTQRIQD